MDLVTAGAMMRGDPHQRQVRQRAVDLGDPDVHG
jgi:hypothetical protein